MSHYAIAVFSYDEDFDRLLKPYNEENEDEFVFEPVSEEEIEERWQNFKKQNPNWEKEDFIKQSYEFHDGTHGNYYNPHGYYDWYTLDGRDYLFEIKGNEYPDHPMKSDYDWYRKESFQSEQDLIEEWKKYSTEGDGWYKPEYYLERYGTEEQYIKESMRPTLPYAFVTPDGVWHAPGEVGWFAMSDETAESMDKYYEEWRDFIDNGPDCYVSLVDCHI